MFNPKLSAYARLKLHLRLVKLSFHVCCQSRVLATLLQHAADGPAIKLQTCLGIAACMSVCLNGPCDLTKPWVDAVQRCCAKPHKAVASAVPPA